MTLLKPLMVPLLPMIEPTLDLDLTAATLDQRITFTRASTETYYDSAGIMRTAAVNEWPRQYDPSTVTRVNYEPYSNDLSVWTNNAGVRLTPSDELLPLLTPLRMTKIEQPIVSSANNRIYRGSGAVTGEVTVSFYLKAVPGSSDLLRISLAGAWVGASGTYDLDPASGSAVRVGGDTIAWTIQAAGNGCFRFSATCPNKVASWTSAYYQIKIMSAGAEFGGGTGGVYFGGLQLETGATVTEYIPTGSTPAGDAVCMGRSVWEQRTNLLLRSQEFDNGTAWAGEGFTTTANALVGPDGTLTADKIIETAANSQHRVNQTVSGLTIGATYAYSVYAKAGERSIVGVRIFGGSNVAQANFDLATGQVATVVAGSAVIVPLVNGWYRCIVFGVAAATTNFVYAYINGASTYTGDGTSGIYLWGAQLELGAFASPYIPTTSAAVTRSADDVNINDLPGIGYSVVAGTAVIEATQEYVDDDSNLPLFEFHESGVAYWRAQISLVGSRTGQPDVLHRGAAGQQQARGGNDDYSPPKATVRFATTFDNTDLVLVASGTVKGTTTSAFPPPNPTKLQIGKTGAANYSRGLAISRFRYWPDRLSGAELQGLTG